ncbi:camp-dependent protein kinase catalytic subunit [Apophysomyces sp. BC1034]|nr:camp-dependent protein kinase catalytic subunit [Apophysomyces sp. BC1015]KAG0180524.1 camp-dependent protein kinase catalytic subunit [Apophysomyces sp. BC1021]KAG0191000.1 camp-dependent protein kinase catalytic subunit [Apophysomyces sp. BC1034]
MISKLIDKAKHPRFSFNQQRKKNAEKSLSTPRSSTHEDRISVEEPEPFLTEGYPYSPPQTPSSGSFLTTAIPALENHSDDDETDRERSPVPPVSVKNKCSIELKLQDFRLQRTLGTGSFGRVHLAQSKYNDRYYAVKVLKKSEIVRMKQVEHTRNERSVLMSIEHPFIVNLWATFTDCSHIYMVMDFVPGGELFSYLRRVKRFSDDVARFYSAEVLLALIYLHKNCIVYRDLKPENLLLDTTGHIKITDFGFAKRLPDDITYTLCGTPDYLAPEIIQSKGYSKAVDFWSLGVLIYEMLAGHAPFYADSQFKLYEKIMSSRPKYPSYFDSSAKDLLKHLLISDKTMRYGNLKKGYRDIMDHKWFASIDFEKLEQRKVKAPYIPRIRGEGDASNFQKYDEDDQSYGLSLLDPHQDLFAEF